jgi:hypothetical protein
MDWVLSDPMVFPNDEDATHGVGGHHHNVHHAHEPRSARGRGGSRLPRPRDVEPLHRGSSVFASPGYANPTYTIVQLALRLGDHLAKELRV